MLSLSRSVSMINLVLSALTSRSLPRLQSPQLKSADAHQTGTIGIMR